MPNYFADFCADLKRAGFSMGGGNPNGIFAVVDFPWDMTPPGSPVVWHTGDPETDPWEWRMRVLAERSDIAYAKVFFRLSGFITDEWYPDFLAVRRGGESFDEAYSSGRISSAEKRIYEAVNGCGELATHEIKTIAGFRREENAAFEKAIVDLQMGMFITMCGQKQKKNKYGEEYGWNSASFCTVERFWKTRGVELDAVPIETAARRIAARVKELNPAAVPKRIRHFIIGR